jgi:hypothetical protein
MNKPDHIPDLLLERYILGELSTKDMDRVSTLAGEDKDIQNRIRDIISSNREILAQYPPRNMAERIEAKINAVRADAGRTDIGRAGNRREQGGFLFRPFVLAGFAAVCTVMVAAFLLLPLVLPSPDGTAGTGKELTRIKGGNPQAGRPLLSIFKRSGDQVQKLDDGSIVHEHDTIQLQYFSAGDAYGVIFSIDGRGSVTLHFPTDSQAGTALTPERNILLPNSFELDDAPGFERFFFITASSPVDTPRVLGAAERAAEHPESVRTGLLRLPDTYKQTSFILIKGD